MSANDRDQLVPLGNNAVSTHHAVEQIRAAIVSGRLAPGTRLIEVELAQQLGLSRGPVREALRELSRQRLVALRPNRGAVVASISEEDVIEVYALRASLGMLALRALVADGPAPAAALERLEQLARRAAAQAGRRRQAALVEADLAFQLALAEESGLPRVAERFRELTAEVQMFVNALQIRYTDVEQILREHAALIEALRAGSLPDAEQLWLLRFRRSAQEFIELLPEPHELAPAARALLAVLEG
jgi:GntR family transcriptional regulator, trigonelline degradation regulator